MKLYVYNKKFQKFRDFVYPQKEARSLVESGVDARLSMELLEASTDITTKKLIFYSFDGDFTISIKDKCLTNLYKNNADFI
jgi:hypothetical protein